MPAGMTVGSLLQSRPESIAVKRDLIAGGRRPDRPVRSPHILKTGLALLGFHEYLHPRRVLVFGEVANLVLESLQLPHRRQTMSLTFAREIPYLRVTSSFEGAPEVSVEAERASVPLLRTLLPTPTAMGTRTSIVEDHLVERGVIHSVLMDILGFGTLIRMPVAPWRNVAIAVGAATRNQLLRSRGHNAAPTLADRIDQRMSGTGDSGVYEADAEDDVAAGDGA
jgi:serine kinase of HPr protein (carbohydrate metabolism regulator)